MTINQFAIGNNTTAYTCSQGNHDKVFHPFSSAIHHFTQCGGIGIVGQDNRQFKLVLYELCQRYDAFPGQVGGVFNSPRVNWALFWAWYNYFRTNNFL